MITKDAVRGLAGTDVYGNDGDKIGSVGQVYLDNATGEPAWVSVRTGLFGTKESFVPLRDADLTGDRVEVPYGKDQVKSAPRIDQDGELSPAEEEELYEHYGLGSSGSRQAGTTTDDAMTRSEERLVAGTRTEQAEKVRLRKYVVTEYRQVEVPVSREEVRLERVPVTDATTGQAIDDPAVADEEHEVTLWAERPVVTTEAVPVERVRLGKETVSGEETVVGEVRKEQIELTGDDSDRDRRR